jgi:sucrose-6-phosphate hydrolase SacC (GH32 family)
LLEWEFVSVLFTSNYTIGARNMFDTISTNDEQVPTHGGATNGPSGWAAPISNMFECPDFFPIGPALPSPSPSAPLSNSSANIAEDANIWEKRKWMFVTSQIFQGHAWVTGGNHHWSVESLSPIAVNHFSLTAFTFCSRDQYRIGSFDGVTFKPEVQGVLDYGYVAAGKTGGRTIRSKLSGRGAATEPDRRVFFGWNMPWSRQGDNGAEGPFPSPPPLSPAALTLSSTAGNKPNITWPNMAPFGSQVLPRDLSLFPDGTLRMRPVPELAALRLASRKPVDGKRQHDVDSNNNHYHADRLTSANSTPCIRLNGTMLEVEFTIMTGATQGWAHTPDHPHQTMALGAVAGISILSTGADMLEHTLVGANQTHLIVDQRKSSLTPDLTPEELRKVRKNTDGTAV